MTFPSKVSALAAAYPLSVTSWYRSVKRNNMPHIRGAKNSLHLVGLAVDVVLDDRKQAKVFIGMAKRLKLWTLNEGDHIHVQEII